MLTLTTEATTKIQAVQRTNDQFKGKCFRIGVQPGGCAGLMYLFGFDDKKDQDIVVQEYPISVIVNVDQLEFLKGATVDYQETLEKSGLIVTNPNVKSSCGCGKSVC